MSGRGKGGKGKGGGGKGKRHHKVTQQIAQNITKPAIRRLARRAGIKRISALIYTETRYALIGFLENVLRQTSIYADHAKKQTMSAWHVVLALKQMDRPVLTGMNAEQTDQGIRREYNMPNKAEIEEAKKAKERKAQKKAEDKALLDKIQAGTKNKPASNVPTVPGKSTGGKRPQGGKAPHLQTPVVVQKPQSPAKAKTPPKPSTEESESEDSSESESESPNEEEDTGKKKSPSKGKSPPKERRSGRKRVPVMVEP